MLSTTLEQKHQLPDASLIIDWEAVFRINGQKLQNFIRKRVANREDVEDLAQMTYLEVLRNSHKFSGASRPETWVFGIALNLIKNYYKAQKGRYLFDTIDDEIIGGLLHDADPSNIIENQRAINDIADYIEKLPAEIQEMLSILIDQDGSYEDVALSLNIPIGTVRSRLSRARKAIKSRAYS